MEIFEVEHVLFFSTPKKHRENFPYKRWIKVAREQYSIEKNSPHFMGVGKIKKLKLTYLKIFINVKNKIYSFSSRQNWGEENSDKW